jgi:hypothetical protein
MRYAAFAIPGFLAVFGGPAVLTDETCVELVVGQPVPSALVVGEVCLELQGDELRVNFRAADGWRLAETQLIVASSMDGIPRAGEAGVPIVGRFPYRTAHTPTMSEFAYVIPLADLGVSPGDEVIVAAHAGLTNNAGIEEGGWGRGERFTPRGNPATFFSYTITGG